MILSTPTKTNHLLSISPPTNGSLNLKMDQILKMGKIKKIKMLILFNSNNSTSKPSKNKIMNITKLKRRCKLIFPIVMLSMINGLKVCSEGKKYK